ncbi:LuxR family transcriptional regulator [Pseudarthrobacter sp. NPDC092184]|jgi:cobalamin biosynthesis Mg chelatase CobN|uniref:LuxR family transcriptional regulator n=1 Tax=unclassified Pseudarthrobacter TaxID=2647000 RepID=UPI0038176DC4
MRTILKSALLALLLIAAPAFSLGAAQAMPSAGAAPVAAQEGTAPSAAGSAVTGTSPTPSPGDTASTGPANPGTGESAENEATRVNYAPWFIAGIAVVVLILILVWRRRRNTTIV